jgi:hypothetical protein
MSYASFLTIFALCRSTNAVIQPTISTVTQANTKTQTPTVDVIKENIKLNNENQALKDEITRLTIVIESRTFSFEQELAQVHADKKKLINDKKILQDKLLRQKKPKS